MSFTLLEIENDAFFAVLLLSLILTVVAYGMFPLIIAYSRKKEITAKKYRLICYAVNFAIMICFSFFSETPNAFPYILWTGIFSWLGLKKLKKDGLIVDKSKKSDYKQQRYMDELESNGYVNNKNFSNSSDIEEFYAQLNNDVTVEKEKNVIEKERISFCRKCGEKLSDDSLFCRKCGTKIIGR